MFIAEIIIATAEIVYFWFIWLENEKKQRKKCKKWHQKEKSVKNLKDILEEDFKWELEARKNKILDEFTEKLYGYHMCNGCFIAGLLIGLSFYRKMIISYKV